MKSMKPEASNSLPQTPAMLTRNAELIVYGGGYFDLLAPRADAISFETISVVLSRLCRFAGHCPVFYSVAEHSALAALAARLNSEPLEVQRALLLHDAAETYIGDVPRPLKNLLPVVSELEDKILSVIGEVFAVDFSDSEISEKVKRYDNILLKAEAIHFWGRKAVESWHGFDAVEDLSAIMPVSFGMEPSDARSFFREQAGRVGLTE